MNRIGKIDSKLWSFKQTTIKILYMRGIYITNSLLERFQFIYSIYGFFSIANKKMTNIVTKNSIFFSKHALEI